MKDEDYFSEEVASLMTVKQIGSTERRKAEAYNQMSESLYEHSPRPPPQNL